MRTAPLGNLTAIAGIIIGCIAVAQPALAAASPPDATASQIFTLDHPPQWLPHATDSLIPSTPTSVEGITFDRLDINHDGKLTLDEFKVGFAGRMPDDQIKQIFDRLDADHDGTLTPEEFSKMRQRGGRGRHRRE